MGTLVLEPADQDPGQEGEDGGGEVEGPALVVQPQLVQEHALEPVLPDHSSNHHLVDHVRQHAREGTKLFELGHGLQLGVPLSRGAVGVQQEGGQHRDVLVLQLLGHEGAHTLVLALHQGAPYELEGDDGQAEVKCRLLQLCSSCRFGRRLSRQVARGEGRGAGVREQLPW